MNKYNPGAKCPKCGCGCIKSTYWKQGAFKMIPGGSYLHPEDGMQYTAPCQIAVENSHIERECLNCDYTWEEAPLDHEESP